MEPLPRGGAQEFEHWLLNEVAQAAQHDEWREKSRPHGEIVTADWIEFGRLVALVTVLGMYTDRDPNTLYPTASDYRTLCAAIREGSSFGAVIQQQVEKLMGEG